MTKTLLEYVRYMTDDELERLSNSDLLDYIGEYLNGGYRP